MIYNSGRGYLGVYFSDTQQYSAYKLGETTEYGVVSDLAYSTKYYNTLYYHAAVDLSYNDASEKDTIVAYSWSCDGIKCCACTTYCPTGAKKFDDPDFLSHTAMLEQYYTEERKENAYFL